jgi:hypothetical protein
MKGREEKNREIIRALEEQVNQLGDELNRALQFINNRPAPAQEAPESTRLITEQDEANYGSDLIDLAKRAAKEAVNPDLSRLEQENTELKTRLQREAQRSMHQALDAHVPEWRSINRDPRFKRWLSLPDLYSGSVRGRLLSAAWQAADAPRVVAFFKGFISDGVATGHVEPAPQTEQPIQSVPRQAAVPLETLAAPGRARPAGDVPPSHVDKPTYTRDQIKAFYRDVRAGVYRGREQAKASIEADLIAAQGEGRIR